jgi:DNA-binding XRE family transcriptional regulator
MDPLIYSKEEILSLFSQHLKQLRIQRFKSQKAAAKACEIPDQSYRNFEEGVSLPSVYEILKIIRTFQIDLQIFFKPFIDILPENKDLWEVYSKFQLIKRDPVSAKVLQKFFEIIDIWNEDVEKKRPLS